jgi:hypothetical protein
MVSSRGGTWIAAIEVKPAPVSLRQAWWNLVWVLKVHPYLRFKAPSALQNRGFPPAVDAGDYAAPYFRAIPS